MTVIGLTGQTGAGKTTVANRLRERGVKVLDADLLAREVIDSSKNCLGDIVLEFGCDMITHHGELNRKKLGKIVFADRQKLRRLNAITRPHIVRRLKEELESCRLAKLPLVVLDAPTLYDAHVDNLCRAVIAVLAPEEIRLRRIMTRDGLNAVDAQNRIHSQHGDLFYKKRAQFIVENTGTREELIGYVDEILDMLLPKKEGIHEKANV